MHGRKVSDFAWHLSPSEPDLWFGCVRPHLDRLYEVGQDWTWRVYEQTRRVQGNLVIFEDRLNELFIQLGES